MEISAYEDSRQQDLLQIVAALVSSSQEGSRGDDLLSLAHVDDDGRKDEQAQPIMPVSERWGGASFA